MKELFKNLYAVFFKEDLIKTVTIEVCPPPPIVPKTNREKLIDISNACYNIDPTPRDEQEDGNACVHSLTTIIKKLFPDFPIMTYTPYFLQEIQLDKRFKPTLEFKEGNIIISPTMSGAGRLTGHTGLCGKNGKILSNASSSGLWTDKYDNISWIQRYSKDGGLDIYLFELL